MTTGNVEPLWNPGPESLEEQLRRKNVQPIRSGDDVAIDGLFESDEELDEFLTDVHATRRAEPA